jgi:hypothetical protein
MREWTVDNSIHQPREESESEVGLGFRSLTLAEGESIEDPQVRFRGGCIKRSSRVLARDNSVLTKAVQKQ